MDGEIDFRTLIFGRDDEKSISSEQVNEKESKEVEEQPSSLASAVVAKPTDDEKKRGRPKYEESDVEEGSDLERDEEDIIHRVKKRVRILYENAAKAQNLPHVPTEPIPPNFHQIQQQAFMEEAPQVTEVKRNENIARLHPADATWQANRRRNLRHLLKYDLKDETKDVGRSIAEAIKTYKLDQLPLPEPKIPADVLKANDEVRAFMVEMQMKREKADRDAEVEAEKTFDDDEQLALLRRFGKEDGNKKLSAEIDDEIVRQQKQGMYEIDTDYTWVEEGRLMPYRYGPILKEYERHLARSINQQREITDSEESLHQDDGPRLQIKTSAKGFEKGRERQNEYRQKEFLSHFPWARSVHESQGYGSRPEIVQHRNFLRLAARFVIAADFSSKSNRQFISREVPTAYILNILTRKQLYEERDLIVMQGNLNFLYYCGWLVERGKGNSSQQTLDKLGLSIDRQGYPPMHQIGKAFPTPRSMRHWVAKSRSVMGQLRGDSFLNSTFSLIPGAEPPIPPKPMDAPSFLLGPMESTPLINPFPVIGQSSQRLSAALLMEWLLSRRGSARANAERKLIKTLLCNIRVASKAQRKIQVTSLASRGYSYACFSTLALYADIMINSFSFRKVLVGSDQGETSALQKRLKAVYLCIDTEIIKGFLKPFARIHAIHGQLRFSYELPVAALHLLREGFNDTDRRTPFDLIRLTLEYMEANNALTDDIYDRGSKAYVPALDLAFFSSAKSFTAAFKADPIDPLYLAWHLAASSACLLLCSGNLIDSFPRCYPSEKIRLDENSDSEASTDCFPHEVREQLDKFEDLRKDVAMSFDMLYELCKQQKSCVSHLCVSSFLEWKQVVALVFGSKLTEDLGSSFVRLHSFHTTQWALQDNSSYARSYLARTQIRDEFIEHLASTLENDPESIDHWRKLVRHLGPISKNSPENAAKRNENIQSDSFLSTKHPASTEETDWKSSRTYWVDSLLTSCLPRTLPFDKESDFRMHRNVARFLEDEEVEQNLIEQQSSHGQVPCLHQDSWFDILCPQNDNSESDDDDSDDDSDESLQDGRPSKDERLRIHDQILPRAVAEILSQPETLRKPPFSRLHLEDDEEGERIEILCYKAFLLCHFGKKEHPAVSQISQLLIEACWNADRNSVIRSRAEWRAIVWLHRKGVPITHPFPKEMPPLHVPKSPQRAQKGPRKNSTLYPKAMCDAVKEGIRLFGFKQWVLIQATYPIFDGHHRRKAEKCYHFMVKTGLMDPHEEDDGKWRRWKKT